MAKSLTAPYEAGRRAPSWLKIKRLHTLDLVVLAAEWGSGRRKGFLSNLHLAARDEATGGFVMLGKTFKGMTDEMLAWQTTALLARETGRDEMTVHVRPELVVEIAFNDLQASPHYPGGLALRFARVKRYRADKSAQDADTIETVRAIHQSQLDRGARVQVARAEPSAAAAARTCAALAQIREQRRSRLPLDESAFGLGALSRLERLDPLDLARDECRHRDAVPIQHAIVGDRRHLRTRNDVADEVQRIGRAQRDPRR